MKDSILTPGAIYESDNGRLICRECAGMAASMTGRDISGQKIRRMTDRDAREWLAYFGKFMRCEAGCTTLKPKARRA